MCLVTLILQDMILSLSKACSTSQGQLNAIQQAASILQQDMQHWSAKPAMDYAFVAAHADTARSTEYTVGLLSQGASAAGREKAFENSSR